MRDSTHDRYADYVRLHIKPTLGGLRLAALTPPVLQQLYARKLAQGLSPRTVQHLHRVLHRACHQAVRWGYLASNPVDRADPPRVPKAELHPPSVLELAALFDACAAAHDRLGALYVVAACSGCRQGELLGLQWRDVDLERGTLTVRRALVKATHGVPTFAEPKTAGSRRTLHLPDEAVDALRRHRQRQPEERLLVGPGYDPHKLVFCTQIGTPLLMSNLFRAFKAALERAGLPRSVRFHDLRHAHASLLLAGNAHPKVVSGRLGHSQIALTLDTYSHVTPALDADAAAIVQRMIRPAPAARPGSGQLG